MGMANLQRMAHADAAGHGRGSRPSWRRRRSRVRPAEAWSRAIVTGKQELLSLAVGARSAMSPEDIDMLQDLVVAAVDDALKSSRKLAEQKLGAVAGGLGAHGRWPGRPPRQALGLRGESAHPAGRPADRGVHRLPGIGPESAQRLASTCFAPPSAGADPGRGTRGGQRMSSSASAASTSPTTPLPDLPRPGRDQRASASSRSRSTSLPSSGPASSVAATTSSTGWCGSTDGPDELRIGELLRRVTTPRRARGHRCDQP